MGDTISRTPTMRYNASEGAKFSADTTLECVECPTCGILYAIPESLVRSARKYHGDRESGWKICCPLGHTWWYTGETEVERERRLANAARDDAARARAQRDQARSEVTVQKRRASRFKNDRDREREHVHAGVCPVKGCRRHFVNLGRHMETKHPNYERGSE